MISAILLLGAVGWMAWRRYLETGDRPRLMVRVPVTAAAMGSAFGVLLGVEAIPNGWGDAALMTAGALLLMTPIIALLVLVVELVVWRMRPARTRKWLPLSIALFALILLLIPAGLFAAIDPGDAGGVAEMGGTTVSMSASNSSSDWELLQVVAIIIAGAMLWWSYLPSRDPRLTDVFE